MYTGLEKNREPISRERILWLCIRLVYELLVPDWLLQGNHTLEKGDYKTQTDGTHTHTLCSRGDDEGSAPHP